MTLSEYSQLKDHIILNVSANEKHTEILNSLKEVFREDINSVRRLEQISNVRQLLSVLEIRDLLSEDNVAPLKDIARQLPNCSELLRRIAEYEEFHAPGELITFVKIPSKQKELGKSQCITKCVYNSDNSVKTQRIFRTISEEIGTQWRNLARYLKTRECVIMEIDSEAIPLSKKAIKILDLHLERANPQTWFFDLSNALVKVHRTDLMLSLQEIMSMNI